MADSTNFSTTPEMTLSEIKAVVNTLERAIQGSDPETVLVSLRSLQKLPINKDILSVSRYQLLNKYITLHFYISE